MRTDWLYLADIVAAADSIARFIAGMEDDAAFYTDELRQSAILQKLIVIGEAASRLSREFCAARPEVEWADIVGFRNIAVKQGLCRRVGLRLFPQQQLGKCNARGIVLRKRFPGKVPAEDPLVPRDHGVHIRYG